MLGARASLWIQERVLCIEVVKTTLWNYFKNRQGLITEDTYRQFATRYKFFHQQFAIVLSGFLHCRIEFRFVLHTDDADRGTLARRFHNQRHGNFWALTNIDNFPLRSDDVVLAKVFFR